MPLISPSSMASSFPHQFYSISNFTFPTDFSEFPPPDNGNNSSVLIENRIWGSHHQDNNFVPVLDNGGCDTMSSSSMPTFSDHLGGISELVAMPAISDCKMGTFHGGASPGIAGFQNFSGAYQPHVGEFGEECCAFVEDIKPPAYPNTARENWGYQGNQMAAVEEPNIKVGRYSEEERKERILRYLKKRNQRNFNKTIKYACRKTLADRRVRVRGRFARNNELCDEEMTMKKNQNPHKQDLYGADSIQFQVKNDDDEEHWLQEAMASLVYLSHSSPDNV